MGLELPKSESCLMGKVVLLQESEFAEMRK